MLNAILLTTGLFGVLGRPVGGSAASALMVVAGLSVYLSVSVFERARELLQDPAYRRKDALDMFNVAVQRALGQALPTCGAVLVVASAIMIVCRDGVMDFGLILFIGALCAVFSSVFVAVPVVMVLAKRQDAAREKKA